VLASVLGGFVPGQRGQRCAAALMTVLAATSLVLAPAQGMWPATVAVAMTLIALRTLGLPRRREAEPLVPEPTAG